MGSRALDPKPLAEAEKKVGVWIRVSTEDQARGESPIHHELRAKSYADSRGWEVAAVYHLEGVSGKSVKDHPEARRMMIDIREGRITGLIFSKLARLARNTKELLEFAEFFREYGADLVSLQESIDTSTPHGRLFYTMIAAMAQWEREETGARVAASIPVRARLGKPISQPPAFGYRWHEKKIEPHPDEAPIRRRIYELFKEYRRLRTVARMLNDAGYRTRQGSRFTSITVERLIRDPTAKGLRRANYTRLVKGRMVLKPESEWVWTEVAPLVSAELWDECNAILTDRRASRTRVPKRAVSVFAGYVFCTCGEKMYLRSNTPKYVCEACRTKIPRVDLEAIFQSQLRDFTVSPEAIAAYLSAGHAELAEREELLAALVRERERLRAETDKLYRLYQEDGISVEGFRERHRPLEERLRGLGGEIPGLQGQIDALKIRTVMKDEMLARTRDLAEEWQAMSGSQKRTVVEALLERVTVGRETVEIDLIALPPFLEMMANGPHSPRPPCRPGWGPGRQRPGFSK